MIKFIKNIFGITKIEQQLQFSQEKLQVQLNTLQEERERILKQEKEMRLSTPEGRKKIATDSKEPWCEVINFRTNPENMKFGFFELDWNQYHIDLLIAEGFGFDGDPHEEIIARWFKYINLLAATEEGIDMTDRNIGHIDVKKLTENFSAVS